MIDKNPIIFKVCSENSEIEVALQTEKNNK